ncbi:MAG: hypothetical protein ABJG94_09655 [Nitratireductor sp.]
MKIQLFGHGHKRGQVLQVIMHFDNATVSIIAKSLFNMRISNVYYPINQQESGPQGRQGEQMNGGVFSKMPRIRAMSGAAECAVLCRRGGDKPSTQSGRVRATSRLVGRSVRLRVSVGRRQS